MIRFNADLEQLALNFVRIKERLQLPFCPLPFSFTNRAVSFSEVLFSEVLFSKNDSEERDRPATVLDKILLTYHRTLYCEIHANA